MSKKKKDVGHRSPSFSFRRLDLINQVPAIPVQQLQGSDPATGLRRKEKRCPNKYFVYIYIVIHFIPVCGYIPLCVCVRARQLNALTIYHARAHSRTHTHFLLKCLHVCVSVREREIKPLVFLRMKIIGGFSMTSSQNISLQVILSARLIRDSVNPKRSQRC